MSAAGVLRRRMRRARRRHANRTIWRQFEDVYVWVFAVLLVVVMAGSAARRLNLGVGGCRTLTCYVAEDRFAPILLVLLVAVGLRVAVGIGPVAASNAAGFWLLSSPLDRAAVLRPAYLGMFGVVAAVAVAGAIAGMAVPGLWSLGSVVFGFALVLAVLVCVASIAVLGQTRPDRRRWLLWPADLLLLVAAVEAWRLGRDLRETLPAPLDTSGLSSGLGAGISIGTWDLDRSPSKGLFDSLGPDAAVFGVVAVGVLAVLAPVLGWRALRRLGVASVVAGGDLVAGLAGAAASLDVGLLADVVATRRWREIGRVRSGGGAFTGAAAIVQRELRRVLRWPRRLVVGAALLVVPYAVAAVGNIDLTLLAALVAGLFATRPFVEGLRTVSRSPGLSRGLPLSAHGIKLAYAVVPGLFGVLWAAAAVPAFTSEAGSVAGLAHAGVVASAVIAGVVRHGSSPRPSYDGPLLSTPAGALPPGLMSQPARGLDVAVLALLPALLDAPPALALAVAVAVLALVLAVGPSGSS